MNSLFQNKKVLIAAGVSVGVIILAIIIFIAIGVKDRKAQKRIANEMHFDNTVAASAEPTSSSEPENKTDNTVKPARKDNDEMLEDLDEQSSAPILSFVDGLLDEDKMDKFIDKYMDVQAYLAYMAVDYDDSSFLDAYEEIDESDVDDKKEEFSSITKHLQEVMETKQGLSELSNTLDSNTTNTENEDELGIFIEDVSEVENYNEEDERFSRVNVTVNILSNEKDLVFTFFEDVVINITDDEGNDILDVLGLIE